MERLRGMFTNNLLIKSYFEQHSGLDTKERTHVNALDSHQDRYLYAPKFELKNMQWFLFEGADKLCLSMPS